MGDDDAIACVVTSYHRLSICHFEDVLQMQCGNNLVLYIKKDAYTLDLLFCNMRFRNIAKAQHMEQVSGETIKIARVNFLVIKASVLQAN